MINRVLDLQNLRLRDLATPMEKAATITTKTTVEEAMRISRETKTSRLAVWREDGKNRQIAGIVSLRAMIYQTDLNPARPAADFLKPALYLEDGMRLEVALKRMQRSGQRLAIVLGADRRELGIVSLSDIIRFIFGEVKL
jgi:CBS domain containing-hemolysin-like protein